MLRGWKPLAGLSLTAVLVLVLSAVGALPAAATGNGNSGDIWTEAAGTSQGDVGHSQDSHIPCGSVDVWAEDLDQASGTWVLYHMPPPDPAQAQVTTGSYSYSGDGKQKIATIDEPVLLGATGPKFKLEVGTGDNKKSKVFWLDCDVSLTTTPNPSQAAIGATLMDTATLGHAFSPTGSITFTLYNPNNDVADTETVAVSGDGQYATPGGHVADSTGTWHWKADYSGDGRNPAVTTKLCDEPVVVTKAEPEISTTPDPESAALGDTLNDKATLSNGHDPAGTITFTLYDPNDVQAYTETVDVNGNGLYSTPNGHVVNAAGTWHWAAAYSGDANNKPVNSDPKDEPVTVTEEAPKAQPKITTSPDPDSAIEGATLKDRATLSDGNNPTGHITFTLYDPNDVQAYTETVDVNGNGLYSTPNGHVADAVGTWHWQAEYSGDQGNNRVTSGAEDEPVTVGKFDPTLTTQPSPASVTGSATLIDTATLTGYKPTGSITFTLYDPSSVAKFTQTVAVAGNGQYSVTGGYAVNAVGTWHWQAVYSGDPNNSSVTSNLADEPVTVTGTGEVLADTGITPPGEVAGLVLAGIGFLAVAAAVARRRPLA